MGEKIIDIIIPAYNAHQTLSRTLASIASQSISDVITVTIVNDCSTEDYSKFVNIYSSVLDIKEIKLEKNVGCGMARQIGIDNTTNKYIMFVDADDMLASPFTCFALLKNIESVNNGKKLNIVYGAIHEVKTDINNGGIVRVLKADHGTWVFGSIFRRSFIEDNGIRFNDSSRGEDVSFNKICKLLSDPDCVGLLDMVTYYWADYNTNRINNEIFQIMYAKVGHVENLLYVYDFLDGKTLPVFGDEDMKYDAIANFMSLYFQYTQLFEELDDAKEYISVEEIKKCIGDIIDMSNQLYQKTFTKYDITDDDISYIYNMNMEIIMKGGALSIKGVTFWDYLNAFGTGNYDILKEKLFELL